jgi:hypothetical protein
MAPESEGYGAGQKREVCERRFAKREGFAGGVKNHGLGQGGVRGYASGESDCDIGDAKVGLAHDDARCLFVDVKLDCPRTMDMTSMLQTVEAEEVKGECNTEGDRQSGREGIRFHRQPIVELRLGIIKRRSWLGSHRIRRGAVQNWCSNWQARRSSKNGSLLP